ncbi:MAG TPA: ribonuclease P protein component [Porphyromonadaceae bacterium]|jgi:ribonuclease P protein component|uniref:ribonuclease P protein component n=1 Tax=Limibacterium fermenti TaxID=3229863 RepID=UPI000E94A913|nr:ribonuclease P protein component [Porphyromonadaceae bacterium]HBL34806.1 ribonuclease P protein component [Porphyromonadaceae bacterium]HBX20537.1 ribonuclease P protein component [Porphyromonadaceae bacterium]HBX45788.1 ribonuclease P protein component [Porphyromonadaceae bacterium]HCM22099.1 ribonuclease P protein component [Porphyromonadaceae bacterium]
MNKGQRFTFNKEERVTGLKRIENLFANGQSFIAYPFRVIFVETDFPASTPISMMVSIPKKRIRSAVGRNQMKRRLREAYRLNKHLFDPLLIPGGLHLDIAFVYVKDDLSEFTDVQKSVQKAVRNIQERLLTDRKQKE